MRFFGGQARRLSCSALRRALATWAASASSWRFFSAAARIPFRPRGGQQRRYIPAIDLCSGTRDQSGLLLKDDDLRAIEASGARAAARALRQSLSSLRAEINGLAVSATAR
jgi:hypothetical protein